jgi:predicted DNA-binding transcriptional regulator YafY
VPTHTGTVTLSIDRLAALEVSMAEFEVDATYDPEQCRRDAFGVCWNDPMDVVLRFRADQAPYVRERQWHPTQKIADLPDGGIQLAFRAGGSFEIRRWILGWGDAVEVISPDELRQAIRKILISASSFYRS